MANAAVIISSRFHFDETIVRLTEAISSRGNTLFADIDQSAAAKSVELVLRPTRLLVFGNPKGGTPLMDAFPPVALDLPLKIAVWEENGKVVLAYAAPVTIAERYGVVGKDAELAGMTRTLEAIVASVSG
jgi:uncharacterized protein (DUF302 family)